MKKILEFAVLTFVVGTLLMVIIFCLIVSKREYEELKVNPEIAPSSELTSSETSSEEKEGNIIKSESTQLEDISVSSYSIYSEKISELVLTFDKSYESLNNIFNGNFLDVNNSYEDLKALHETFKLVQPLQTRIESNSLYKKALVAMIETEDEVNEYINNKTSYSLNLAKEKVEYANSIMIKAKIKEDREYYNEMTK